MSLLDLFRKDEVIGAKVLVCALATGFDDLLDGDHEVYRQYYPATSKAIFLVFRPYQAVLDRALMLSTCFAM
jgi:hypothetical protein